jgi:hypothetical protein
MTVTKNITIFLPLTINCLPSIAMPELTEISNAAPVLELSPALLLWYESSFSLEIHPASPSEQA